MDYLNELTSAPVRPKDLVLAYFLNLIDGVARVVELLGSSDKFCWSLANSDVLNLRSLMHTDTLMP
jgi:hypothetical protein